MSGYADVADSLPAKLSVKELDTALADLQGEMHYEDHQTASRVIDIVAGCTGFFSAPASAKFHLNEEHGLFRHSLGVTYRLFALDEAYNLIDDYGRLELFLAGLLHDLGKAGQVRLETAPGAGPQVILGSTIYHTYCEPYYIKKFFKTKPGEFEYKRNPERVGMSIPMSSLHFIGTVLSDVWKPSIAAWQAIGYHDGMYVPEGDHTKHSETKLLLALHQADMFQSRVEGEWATGSGWFG